LNLEISFFFSGKRFCNFKKEKRNEVKITSRNGYSKKIYNKTCKEVQINEELYRI